ncbi:alpha/beta hydrolase [Phenylobacterium sp. J426]|uniref:alpha/beta hydrolase n=1 Tax=Phenylobacterium sp. J426 TaxID=2898439 RepID=UPI00215136B4|nr:alpha/beta hydrolase [Phenylobacterium sp. J426]MCR5873592.1 alpha/beta hydrolase [Phenylobacterium sp. J426]
MTTVVMVHGAFCGGWTFEHFRSPFEARGWRVLAPDLRGHGLGATASDVAGLSMEDYARDLVALCADLPEPPVLVGHSMGGLVCQMAARRVRPQALVLLAPSPPWGVTGSSLEEAITATAVGLLDPFWSGAIAPDHSVMRRHSLDRVPKPYRDTILARMGHESARALREVLNWWLDPFMTTSVGSGALPTPSLAIVGGRDQVHPAATVRGVAERIGAAYRAMPQMSHWLVGEPGWDDVAALALDWLETERRAAA